MKKFLLIPAMFLCLCLGLQGMATASGTSMAMLMDDGQTGVIVLAKFRSNDFLRSEVDTIASQLTQAVQSFGYGSQVYVFNHTQLGDPDVLRPALSQLYSYYETLFLEISKGPAPVSGAMSANNIWVDMSYENMGGMYVGSLGFQEWLTQMTQ